MDRLHLQETFAATLCGARIVADAQAVRFMRDAGETARGGLAPVELRPGVVSVWDGRFEIETAVAAEVRALKGLSARLSAAERREISAFAPAARAALPILAGNRNLSPVLASVGASVRCLVEARLRTACGQTAHERDIAARLRGAWGAASLC
jgi:tRNA(Ile)-lysidine synthase